MDPSQQPQQPAVPAYEPVGPPAPVAPVPQPQAYQPVPPVAPTPVAPAPQPIVPAGAPVQPAAAWNPVAPQQPAQQTAIPAAQPKPHMKMSGRLVMVIVASGLILMALAAYLIAGRSLTPISETDYEDFYTTTSALSEAHTHVNVKYLYITVKTSEEAATAASERKAYYDEFSKQWEKLAASKVAKQDAEVRAVVDKIKEKKTKFDAVQQTNIEVYEKVAFLAGDYYNAENSFKDPVTPLVELRTKASNVSNLKSEANKEYVKNIIAWLDEILPLATKMKAMRANLDLYDPKVLSDYTKAEGKLSNISDTWSDSIESQGEAADISVEIESLSSLALDRSTK